MDNVKLHVVEDFFKHFQIELNQWKIVVEYLEIFVERAKIRGEQLDDNRLLIILDQVEAFVRYASRINKDLEEILHKHVMKINSLYPGEVVVGPRRAP